MRIAVYHNLSSGGAKRALFEQIKRMAERHTLDVFTTSAADHDFADIRPFASRHRVAPFIPQPLFRSPFGRLNQLIRIWDLQRIRRVNRLIAAEIDAGGYDVVFVHPCRIENSPSVLRFITRPPAVLYCHEPLRILYESMPSRPYDRGEAGFRRTINRLDPLPGLFRRAQRVNDRENLRHARRVLVNSGFTQQTVRSIYQIDPSVCYNGVDAERFRPLGLERERYVFSVGSLTPLKGFDFLIESLATIPSAARPELVIASNFQNPPERVFLTDLALNHGVSLRLLDNISDDRLVDLYNRAAATVYAPVREPFGFVSIESMACATPVVAVAEGGIRETVLPGQTGCLSERHPEQFGSVLQELLADPARAQSFGIAGRKHVLQNWTWDKTVQTLEGYLSF